MHIASSKIAYIGHFLLIKVNIAEIKCSDFPRSKLIDMGATTRHSPRGKAKVTS
jgi:hypothetical protein